MACFRTQRAGNDGSGISAVERYACFTPAYPFHDGEPTDLRENISPDLGHLTFAQVVDSLAAFIDTLPEPPVLIGHSMGGLAVQKLVSLNRGFAGICIDTAPPKGVFSLKWSFLKANLPTINPLKGNSPCLPSVEWFHYAFCNTMSPEQTQKEYDLICRAREQKHTEKQHGDRRFYRFQKASCSAPVHRRRRGQHHPFVAEP